MDIKVDILENDDRKAKLVIDGVRPYFVNALRRTLLAEVPKLAIDDVTLYDNTSALFDEMIAHRLALLPIPTDPSTLNLAGKVDDEGNPEYLVRYRLTAEGPKQVTAADMECDDPAFAIADPDIPIVTLLEGQRLILEATAVFGQGTDHARWQVCSAAGYKYYPTAKVDNRKISAEQAETAVKLTPKGILELKDGKLAIVDELNVNRADDAVGFTDGGMTVEWDDRKFVFRFETDGSLKAEDAMLKAVELLKDRFAAFSDAMKDL